MVRKPRESCSRSARSLALTMTLRLDHGTAMPLLVTLSVSSHYCNIVQTESDRFANDGCGVPRHSSGLAADRAYAPQAIRRPWATIIVRTVMHVRRGFRSCKLVMRDGLSRAQCPQGSHSSTYSRSTSSCSAGLAHVACAVGCWAGLLSHCRLNSLTRESGEQSLPLCTRFRFQHLLLSGHALLIARCCGQIT